VFKEVRSKMSSQFKIAAQVACSTRTGVGVEELKSKCSDSALLLLTFGSQMHW
jgi:hypothetical protein